MRIHGKKLDLDAIAAMLLAKRPSAAERHANLYAYAARMSKRLDWERANGIDERQTNLLDNPESTDDSGAAALGIKTSDIMGKWLEDAALQAGIFEERYARRWDMRLKDGGPALTLTEYARLIQALKDMRKTVTRDASREQIDACISLVREKM